MATERGRDEGPDRPGGTYGDATPGGMGGDAPRGAYDGSLVRLCDPGGRPRGTGFVADHHGTVVTSHEAVDGLAHVVVTATGGRRCVATADAVTPLPGLDLALVRTAGLGVAPLPVTVRDRIKAGTYMRIAAGCWREARMLGVAPAMYAAGDRRHLLDDAVELAIGTAGCDALRAGGEASGGPVLDAATGAVIGVLGAALSSAHRDVGFAAPLRSQGARGAEGPLAALLAENAVTVPAYGDDLNLAGVLELTATSVGQDGPPAGPAGPGAVEPVERAGPAAEFAAFEAGTAAVLGLVAPPGSGRTTELAALAARRGRGPVPAPALWLRGADLHEDDTSVADAARRALDRAARIVAASRTAPPTDLGDVTPDRVARLARTAGRPLLLLLDGPEEMPTVLSHRLSAWTTGTADWLRRTGARLVVACRAEYWEEAGAAFPVELLHGADGSVAEEAGGAAGEAEGASPTGVRGTGPRHGAPTFAPTPEPRHASVSGPAPSGAPRPAPAPVPASALGSATIGRVSDAESPTGPGRVSGPGSAAVAPAAGHGPTPGRAAVPRSGPAITAPTRAPSPPACVYLGDLEPGEAREARKRYGIPDGVLGERDAGHPLTLRLVSEVWAALPGGGGRWVGRHDVFGAHLDLMCLRVAVRLAAENGLRGTAVRMLAAKVAGQVHEAARRSLGPGEGKLDRTAFDAVFPWGPAPARLGGGTGWAPAVLAEGLLVPAGTGYRFAHEEFADWIQGNHLDLDEALRVLVHRRRDKGAAHPLPVPHHRVGPVVQALLLVPRQKGPGRLASRLEQLVLALDADPESWWARRLLSEVLTRVPDATPYAGPLRILAERLAGRRERERLPVPREFGPTFWAALPLPDAVRCELLRDLVRADGPPGETGPRFLDAAARLLADRPAAVQPHLVRWFADERPLPATPDATVGTAAQALLHTHRHRAPDDLTEALAGSAHLRAAELLAVLAREEPSALCRAVDRWAHDERPERRAAALTHGLRAAPHVTTEADRTLLRYAALALLARRADHALHGGALALLVRDPHTRARHLPQALRHFAAGDPLFPPSALAGALVTHPDPVLDAFRERLRLPGTGPALRTLADVTTPGLARRVAALVRAAVERRPETAGDVAAYVGRRLDQGPAARAVLLPLVGSLLDDGPEPVRAALAGVLGAPGPPASRPVRRELRETLLAHEDDPAVLDALLRGAAQDDGADLRDLVHRTGLRLVRTAVGATRFDLCLAELSRQVPGFAVRVAGWLTDAPDDWAALVGPSTRRTIENLAGVRVPA